LVEGGVLGTDDARWGDFLAALRASVPILPASAPPELSLSPDACDKLLRAAVLRAVGALAGGLPDELLGSITSLGEAYGWYVQRRDPVAIERFLPQLLLSEDLKSSQLLATDPTVVAAGLIDPTDPTMTHRLKLRPVYPDDVPMLYKAAMDPTHSFRWRYRGATPSVGEFADGLHEGTLVQFIIERLDDGRPQGLVAAYRASMDAGHAYVAFQRISPPGHRGAGEMFEGLYLFVQYLFRTWNFRKLYAEVPGYNYPDLASGEGVLFDVEGRLRDHDYHDDRFWDQYLIAIHRDRWHDATASWGRLVAPPKGTP